MVSFPIAQVRLYPKNNHYNSVFIRAKNDACGIKAKVWAVIVWEYTETLLNKQLRTQHNTSHSKQYTVIW